MTTSSRPQRGAESDELRELLLAVAERSDREAFGEVVRHLTPALIRSAHSMVQPVHYEDLVQETWYRAWRYRYTYRGDASPFAWLHKILVRVAAEDRSLRASLAQPLTEDFADRSAAGDLESVLVADSVDRALAQLDSREAAIVRRRFLAEQSWAIIAREMNFKSPYLAQVVYKQAMRKMARIRGQT